MLTRQGSYVGGVASVAPAASEYKVSHVAYHLRGELRADYITREPQSGLKYKSPTGAPWGRI